MLLPKEVCRCILAEPWRLESRDLCGGGLREVSLPELSFD